MFRVVKIANVSAFLSIDIITSVKAEAAPLHFGQCQKQIKFIGRTSQSSKPR